MPPRIPTGQPNPLPGRRATRWSADIATTTLPTEPPRCACFADRSDNQSRRGEGCSTRRAHSGRGRCASPFRGKPPRQVDQLLHRTYLIPRPSESPRAHDRRRPPRPQVPVSAKLPRQLVVVLLAGGDPEAGAQGADRREREGGTEVVWVFAEPLERGDKRGVSGVAPEGSEAREGRRASETDFLPRATPVPPNHPIAVPAPPGTTPAPRHLPFHAAGGSPVRSPSSSSISTTGIDINIDTDIDLSISTRRTLLGADSFDSSGPRDRLLPEND